MNKNCKCFFSCDLVMVPDPEAYVGKIGTMKVSKMIRHPSGFCKVHKQNDE